MKLLVELNDGGRTIVIITHEDDVAAYASRVVTLEDGRVISDATQRQRRVEPAREPVRGVADRPARAARQPAGELV